LEDEEMSLREQKSDLALATTHYEVKPIIIKLVATKPFRGLEDDNPYRHIKEFTMICYTWFKWNLFRLRTMCGSTTGGWSLPCVMSD
jgi:hypothetical protein